MVKYTDKLKILTILPLVFFRKSNLLIRGTEGSLPIAELFLQNIFAGNPSRTETDVVIAVFGLLEVIVFNLLFGAHIYRDFYENSAYIFVRIKSRKIWFAKKAAELFGYSAIYNALFIGLTFLFCLFHSGQKVDTVAVRILIVTYIMVQLFTFLTTLTINIVAVYLGTVKSFIVNYIALVLCSAAAIKFESIPVLQKFPVLLKLNPVANVVIQWDAGMGEGVLPAIYFCVLIALVYATGSYIISRIDISINISEYA